MTRAVFQRRQLIHKASGMVFNATPALDGHPDYEEYAPEHVVPTESEPVDPPEPPEPEEPELDDLGNFDGLDGLDAIADAVPVEVVSFKRRGRPAKGAANGSHAR